VFSSAACLDCSLALIWPIFLRVYQFQKHVIVSGLKSPAPGLKCRFTGMASDQRREDQSQRCWENKQMKVLNICDLNTTGVYQEFLRVPSLSLGLYRHDVGASVPQEPHTEDEVYFIISGLGAIEIDGADHAVTTGSVVYVPSGVAHHFHSVTAALEVLVAFAPPEGSMAKKPAL